MVSIELGHPDNSLFGPVITIVIVSAMNMGIDISGNNALIRRVYDFYSIYVSMLLQKRFISHSDDFLILYQNNTILNNAIFQIDITVYNRFFHNFDGITGCEKSQGNGSDLGGSDPKLRLLPFRVALLDGLFFNSYSN